MTYSNHLLNILIYNQKVCNLRTNKLVMFIFVALLSGCHYLQQGLEPIKPSVNPFGTQPSNDDPHQNPTQEESQLSWIRTQVIANKCLSCHKPGGKAEDLPFTTDEEIMTGYLIQDEDGRKVPLVTPGAPEKSPLYLTLLDANSQRQGFKLMPPVKAVNSGLVQKVTTKEQRAIFQWIKNLSPQNATFPPQPQPEPAPNTNPSPLPSPLPLPVPSPTDGNQNEPNPVLPTPVEKISFQVVFEAVLKDKCISCHNTLDGDANELSFETESEVLEGESKHVPLVVKGKPRESILFLSLQRPPPSFNFNGKPIKLRQMPPPKALQSGKPDVTPEDVALIQKWIEGL